MPLRRLLDQSRVFDAKQIAVILEAFEGVVAELDLQTGAEATGQANLDAAKLRDGAVALMGNEELGRRPL
jgi:hypothetical protein